MELSKHKNHRDFKYLSWLRKQPCVASGEKAQCAHHIRIGTNGGSAIKPSDYFCIPLLNEYHTTGLFAIHVIGEETFFKQFKLNPNQLFIKYLKQYLLEKFNVHVQLKDKNDEALIAYMIQLIQDNGPQFDRPKKQSKPKKSIIEDEYYQRAKEVKKVQDRQLRQKIKEEEKEIKLENKNNKTKSKSLKGTEFYEKAKEYKRARDKEMRDKIKLDKKTSKISKTPAQSDYYEKAKELKRIRDKEFRAKLKEQRKSSK